MIGIFLLVNATIVQWQWYAALVFIVALNLVTWTEGYDDGSKSATNFWKGKWLEAMEVIRSL